MKITVKECMIDAHMTLPFLVNRPSGVAMEFIDRDGTQAPVIRHKQTWGFDNHSPIEPKITPDTILLYIVTDNGDMMLTPFNDSLARVWMKVANKYWNGDEPLEIDTDGLTDEQGMLLNRLLGMAYEYSDGNTQDQEFMEGRYHDVYDKMIVMH